MQDSAELLRLLHAGEVDFVIIGGVAAIAYGSATLTQDFDVTIRFDTDNLARLISALSVHHPRFALTTDKRPLTLEPEQLARYKNLDLLTDLGRLDLLSEVPPVGSFERIRQRAEVMDFFGLQCPVIALDDLIAVKEALGREKDRPVVLELRAIRERRK